VKQVTRLRKKFGIHDDNAPAPKTKDCPHCYSKIHPQATRCPNCTGTIA
jgi:large conductance mechanosensitive channel